MGLPCHRRLVGLALMGLAILVLPRAASAESFRSTFFTAEVFVAARWQAHGFDWGPGARLTALRTEAFVPMGANLEGQWFVRSSEARVAIAAQLSPDRRLKRDACERRLGIARRNRLLAFGSAYSLAAGPTLAWSHGASEFGAAASVLASLGLVSGHARLAWSGRGGIGPEIAAGGRLPSVLGQEDKLLSCN